MARPDRKVIHAAAFKGTSLDPEIVGDKGTRYDNLRLPRERPPDWREVDASKLLQCLQALGEAGDAVILGLTADGGSFSLTLLTGVKPPPRYHPHTVAELELMLGMITSAAVQAKHT